jgi:hypothetical protein
MKILMIRELGMKKILLVAIMYVALISSQHAYAGSTELTTEEVIELISGKTVHGTSSRGSKYKMYFGGDNSLKAGDGSTGTWEVKDGSVCNTWDDRGFAGCDKVYRKSNGKIFYKVESGKKGKFRKFEDGDQL